MIHFITWIPLPYQLVLCRALHAQYGSELIVWYGESRHPEFPFQENMSGGFQQEFLDQCGYGKLAAKLFRDKKAVVMLGGWRSPMSARVLAITTLLRCPLLLWADHPHPRKRNAALSVARRVYLKFLNYIVSGFLACGQPTVEHLASLGLAREKITNFPYWTDIPETWSLPSGSAITEPRETPLRLIAIGRLAEVKKFDVAIQAIASANQKAGYCQATLLLAGEGSERKRLEQLAQSLGCSQEVSFAGWLEPDQIRRALEDADVLVITSSFEAYSAVVLEAMAVGRPVLASDGVIAAIDRDDGTGAIQFHSVGDAETLANQISVYAGDRNSLRKASAASRATAEKWPPMRAITILNDVIARTEAGRRLLNQDLART